MSREELKWHQLAHHLLMSQQGPPHTVKPFIKAQISGKLLTNRISDIAIASVHSEKTRLKNMIMIIISMKKSRFWQAPEMTSAMKLRPEK